MAFSAFRSRSKSIFFIAASMLDPTSNPNPSNILHLLENPSLNDSTASCAPNVKPGSVPTCYTEVLIITCVTPRKLRLGLGCLSVNEVVVIQTTRFLGRFIPRAVSESGFQTVSNFNWAETLRGRFLDFNNKFLFGEVEFEENGLN
ncbi:hypothetical protein J6590_067205 [Homalodisca vitripennis]|nr:hypothetical protein J6590_067205 [Homalodisca vitripennis]